MKTKYQAILVIAASLLFSGTSIAAGPTDVDRQQLKTQIEIRNIQMERYKIERQMMLDLNEIKTHLKGTPSEKSQLEKSFPMLERDVVGYDALKESRNAD